MWRDSSQSRGEPDLPKSTIILFIYLEKPEEKAVTEREPSKKNLGIRFLLERVHNRLSSTGFTMCGDYFRRPGHVLFYLSIEFSLILRIVAV